MTPQLGKRSTLRRSGAKCISDEVNLGFKDSVLDCAAACGAVAGCQFFIYGHGDNAGRCFFEQTEDATCTEGFVSEEYDFYELEGRGAWCAAPPCGDRRLIRTPSLPIWSEHPTPAPRELSSEGCAFA